MQKAVSMDIEALKIMSNKAVNYVRDNHSYDAYEKALNEAISEILHQGTSD